MSIPGTRYTGTAEILIDREKCSSCGACADVCSGFPLIMVNGRLEFNDNRGFGCFACGACVAVCPLDAIRISGRDLAPEDVFRIPSKISRANYESLNSLLLSRRSTRNFKPQEIEESIVQKILDVASTAPVGIPPSEVGVCVFQSRRSVQELRGFLTDEMKQWRWMFSPLALTLLRPFLGKDNTSMYKDFIAPAIELFTSEESEGKDWFFYDAPLAIYFYGTVFSDPADPVIPATLAMLAAEALGLGTCMLGFPGYIFQYSGKARRKYGLPKKIQAGLMVIFGYPVYHNQNALRRRFRQVTTFV